MTKFANHNDLVYAVAARAKELGNMEMPELSRAQYGVDTPGQALKEFAHEDRGTLVENVLLEEFIEEFPREFADE
jgi:DNA-directed RNA polymerase subunit K/omega